MRLSYCPRCLSELKNTAVCPHCGPTDGVRALRPHHLPPGTILGGRVFLGLSRGEDGSFIRYDARRLDTGEKAVLWELFPTGALQREPGGRLRVTDSKRMEELLFAPPLPQGWQGELFPSGGTLYGLPVGNMGDEPVCKTAETRSDAPIPSEPSPPGPPQDLAFGPTPSFQEPPEALSFPAVPMPTVLFLPPADPPAKAGPSVTAPDTPPEAASKESPHPDELPEKKAERSAASPDLEATAAERLPAHPPTLQRPHFSRRRGSLARSAVLLLAALFVAGLLLPQTARAVENTAQQVLNHLLHKREALPKSVDAAVTPPAPLPFPEAAADLNSLIPGGFCQTDGVTLLCCGGDLRLYAESAGERKVLRLNGTALFPLLTEDGLYFVEYGSEGCAICHLAAGASYAEELYVSREELSFLSLWEGKLWFLEGDRLRTLERDGGTETKASGSGLRDLGLTEAGPAWLDDQGLWRKPEGEDPLLLIDRCLSWQFRAGLFYCTTGDEILVLNLLGETLRSYPISCEAISIVSDRLYYADRDTIGCLDLKSGGSESVLEGLPSPAQRLTAVSWQGSDLLWYLTEEDEGRKAWLVRLEGSHWQASLLSTAETE